MFSINGVELDNDTLGWTCRDASTSLSGLTVERPDLIVPGWDGVAEGLDGRASAVAFPLMVETPRANEPALRVLLRSQPLVLTEEGWTGLEARCELLSISPQGWGPADEVVEVTAMLRIPGVYWRDAGETTSTPAAIGSASVAVEVMEGLSAPVRDAIIRVAGGVTNLKVADAGGSFFQYGAVIAEGEYLRFECATGKAFLTFTDVWTGGTEVTGLITNGPGPYPFQLTPSFTDPADRVAALTVTSSARSGSPVIAVRGKRAHEL